MIEYLKHDDIIIRKNKISDAQRFFEILNNPNLIDTGSRPASIDAEEKWIKNSLKNREEGKQYNFTIEHRQNIIGCLGLKINPYRKYVGEIGCFIDEKYRNKGVATESLNLGVQYGFNELKLERIEAISPIDNIGSQKAALKAGFHQEGILRRAIKVNNGIMKDVVIFSKLLSDLLLEK